MDNAVERYRKRRDARLGRFEEKDPVAEYRKRREKRLDARFDASARLAYGIAKGLGIKTEGMSPQEVWEAIKGKDPDAYAAAHSGGKRSKRGQEAASRAGFVNGWKPPKVKGMEPAEVHVTLTKCNKIGGGHYDKAGEVARDKKNTFLWTFTTHGKDHVQQVLDETNHAADEIEKMPANSIFKGAKLDRKLMMVSAWFHDTGMDGGKDDWSKDNGDGIRGAHGTNSAIHILEHAKEIEKLGVNPSQAAFIAFAHTKSKSGINDLTKPEDWKKGLDTLEAAAKKAGVDFDRKSIFGGEPNEDNIHHMMAQVAALRLGDANREAKGSDLLSQSGGKYEIDSHPDMNKVQEMIEREGLRDSDKWKAEVANSEISITDEDGRHVLSDDDPKMSQVSGWKFSARVVLGERNMETVDARYNDKHQDLQEDISLKNGNDVPWSTTEAILERCGELNTINGVPRAAVIYMNGVKNEGAMNKTAREAYDKMWDRIENEPDKKTGGLKYGGIHAVVLVFDDGTKKVLGRNGNNGGNRK